MRHVPDFSKKLLVLTGDAVLLGVALQAAVFARFQGWVPVYESYPAALVAFTACFLGCLYVFDLYDLRAPAFRGQLTTGHLGAVLTGSGLLMVLFYMAPSFKIGRGLIGAAVPLAAAVSLGWRWFLGRVYSSTGPTRRVVIVGAGPAGRAIHREMVERNGQRIVGFLDDDPALWGGTIGPHRVLGGSDLLSDPVFRGGVDSAVVAITHEKTSRLLSNLLAAKLRGVAVSDMQSSFERLTGTIPVEHIRQGWLVYAPLYGVERPALKRRVKRLMDFALSALGLALSWPLILLAAVAIKLDSAGPVFFRQRRVGLNGSLFDMIKLRSMRTDAEKDGAAWARKDDPRATRVGRVLRRLRVDELPQMWNVLKGEMSFVGPRPERPKFVEKLERDVPFYAVRHAVCPGITGWAQVSYPYGASREDALQKLQYDLYYLKNHTLLFDLHILLLTVKSVLFARGSR